MWISETVKVNVSFTTKFTLCITTGKKTPAFESLPDRTLYRAIVYSIPLLQDNTIPSCQLRLHRSSPYSTTEVKWSILCPCRCKLYKSVQNEHVIAGHTLIDPENLRVFWSPAVSKCQLSLSNSGEWRDRLKPSSIYDGEHRYSITSPRVEPNPKVKKSCVLIKADDVQCPYH